MGGSFWNGGGWYPLLTMYGQIAWPLRLSGENEKCQIWVPGT